MARILIHSLVFPPDGVSTAYLMSDLATELVRGGHQVTVLTTTPHYNPEPAAVTRQPITPVWRGLLGKSAFRETTVFHVNMPAKGRKVLARAFDYVRFHVVSLAASLRAVGPYDLVLAPSPPLTMGVLGWLQGLLRGVPAVYNVQEIYPDVLINQGLIRHRWQIAPLRALERFVYARNAMIVPISEWFSQALVKRGVPRAKLTVIPNFVDTELYRPLPRRNTFAEQHALLDRFTVLYGGNLGLTQDWESLLAAAQALSEKPIVFVLVGDGVRRSWLESEIKRRHLTNVCLLGYHPRELMPEINAASDLGTIPMTRTSTTDTFPSKIYTIMACGKPVVVSADPDSELAWLVAQAGCGQVVPPEDPRAYTEAILRAFEDQQGAAAAGERGRQYVRQTYSKEAVGQAYCRLVETLLASASAPGAAPAMRHAGDR